MANQTVTQSAEVLLSKIPSFPPIVLRVLDLASREDVRISQLAEAISADAVFSAQILRLANSALYASGEEVESLNQAVMTLGLMKVQGLAATIATNSYLRTALKVDELRRCWRHTVASAILSADLADACSVQADRGYTLGLLHDMGRLGLLVAYPNDYAEMLRDADREPISLLEAEKARFGFDHCEIGCSLAKGWKLPQDYALVMGRHHDPPSGNILDSTGIAYFACRFADVLGYWVQRPHTAIGFDQVRDALPPAVAARFTLTAEELTELIDQRLTLFDSGDTVQGFQAPRRSTQPAETTEPQDAAEDVAPQTEDPPGVAPISTGPSLRWILTVAVCVSGAILLALLFVARLSQAQ